MKMCLKGVIAVTFGLSILLTNYGVGGPARLNGAVGQADSNRQEMTKSVTLEIPPQEYSYLHYNAVDGTISAHDSLIPPALPEKTVKTIALTPDWLRKPLAKRLQQLLTDYVWTSNNAVICSTDLNKDNYPDLIIGGEDGKLKVYLGPRWDADLRNLLGHINVGSDSAPAIGDMNNDNIPDLAVGSGNGAVAVYAGPKFSEIISALPDFKVDGTAQPIFIDVTKDNKKDLLIYAKDKLYCYTAPDWKENNTILSAIKMKESGKISALDIDFDGADELVVVDNEGKITVYNPATLEKKPGWWETNSANQAMSIIRLDANQDGVSDLVFGRASGLVKYYPNLGTNTQPKFTVFNQRPHQIFTMEIGVGAVPLFADFTEDGKPDLLIANSSGMLRLFAAPYWTEDKLAFTSLKLSSNPVPVAGDINGDAKLDLVIGSKEGQLKCLLGPQWQASDIFSKLEDLPKYSAPCLADIDSDKDLDLLVGGEDGRIALYTNAGSPNEPKFAGKPTYLTLPLTDADKGAKKEPTQLKVNGASVPRIADVNGDKVTDLVIGSKDGKVSVFLGPDWKPETALVESVYGGSYCAPAAADINNDGALELLVTNTLGEYTYYELVQNNGLKRWEEKYSWKPKEEGDESLAKFYGTYYSESILLTSGTEDRKSVDDFTKVLEETPENQRDEVGFAIANTPAEVLRAMARLDQAYIMKENARMIYEIAGKVNYVRIKEKENYSTLEYAAMEKNTAGINAIVWKEVPKDVYYWWIVHPRILYEIPCKIDASWLEKSYSDYGISQDDWWRHQEDWYKLDEKVSRFWRMAMPYDKSNGPPLIERVQRARTLQEAINQLHTWSSPQAPNPFITFGYLSDDLQPWVIYKRRYGSCGEQSIITAALARSMLIPTASVCTRGEDHQWHEYWTDEGWHVWDVCGNAFNDVNTPWTREGYGHTGECSSIMRYWGNDYFDHTTATVCNPKGSKYTTCGSGYTDVGQLTIRVLDADAKPQVRPEDKSSSLSEGIEGAMIILRRPGAVAPVNILGYTDLKGECLFELGKVSPGYNITVLTPYGSAGTRNYFMEENKSYTLEYKVTGKKPNTNAVVDKSPQPLPAGDKSLTLTIDKLAATLNPPARFAITRWTDYQKELKRINYRGSVTAPYPIKQGAINLYVFDKMNFELYRQGKPAKAFDIHYNLTTNNYPLGNTDLYFVFCNRQTLYATENLDVKYIYNTPKSQPQISVEIPVGTVSPLPRNEIVTGDDLTLKGSCADSAGIKTLEVSLDSGRTFHDTSSILTDAGKWTFFIQQFIGGPVPAGKYSIMFKATNYGGLSAATAPLALAVQPAQHFADQLVKQDNPDSPLPKCSWMLGPFVLDPARERFVDIKTTCSTDGTDIDMFLFRDKNNDGKISGMDEKETASTSPSADERISINDVVTGTYWIYCQGWKVEQDNARFNLDLSFYPQPEVIGGRAPNGVINNVQPQVTATLASISDFDPTKLVFKMDGTKIDTGWTLTRTSVNYVRFSYPVTSALADGGKHKAELTATDYLGQTSESSWEFQVDLTKPQLGDVQAEAGDLRGTIDVSAEVEDNVGLRSVTYKLDKLSGQLNQPAERSGVPSNDGNKDKEPKKYAAKITTASLQDDEYELVITAEDKAGNKTEERITVDVKNPALRIFYTFPADGDVTHHLRPLILASYKSVEIPLLIAGGEGQIKTRNVHIWLDDVEITADTLVTPDGLHYQPVEDLSVGKHTLKITVEDAKGNKATHQSAFEVKVDVEKK
ncbi:MAG: VCBS repeat-containing protein [Planctomycetes bacterium]|nr:VCBS repeat-containing protein [Planctomycetota bacterium]